MNGDSVAGQSNVPMITSVFDKSIVEKRDAVRRLEILRGLNRDFVSALVANLDAEVFPPGASLAEEGDKDFAWYLIVNGQAEVLTGPQKRQVATLKGFTIFGEAMAGKHPKRSATVRAVDYCDCRQLRGPGFVRTLRKFPKERELLSSFQAVGLCCGNTPCEDRPQKEMSEIKRLIAEAEALASPGGSPLLGGRNAHQPTISALEDPPDELSSSTKSSLLTPRWQSLSGTFSSAVSRSPRTPSSSSASVSPLMTGGTMLSARSTGKGLEVPAALRLAEAHARRPELPGHHELAALLERLPSTRLAAV